MKITNIKVQSVIKEKKVKALMSVTFDSELVLHDIKVIDGTDGLFVAMPSRRVDSGRFLDTIHFVNKESRSAFADAVLDVYKKQIEDKPAATSSQAEA